MNSQYISEFDEDSNCTKQARPQVEQVLHYKLSSDDKMKHSGNLRECMESVTSIIVPS